MKLTLVVNNCLLFNAVSVYAMSQKPNPENEQVTPINQSMTLSQLSVESDEK